MSSDKKNTTGYSTSDLQKYWRGELSAREMHELESAALEDPFLADALEGMEIQQTLAGSALPEPADFDADLLDLQLQLKQRVARETVRPPIRLWTRWAAAVILFIGMGSITYYTLINRSAQKVSLAKSQSAAPSTTDSAILPPRATAFSQAKAADAATLIQKSKSIHIQSTLNQAARQPPTFPVKAKSEQVAVSPSALALEKIAKDTIDQLAAMDKKVVPGLAPHPLFGNASGAGSNRYKQSLPNHLGFSGKVLDENNHPLAGASVYLNGHGDINTLTDRQGNFNLKLRPLDSALNVMVAYTGYEPTSITLNNADQFNQYNVAGNIIRLQPQQASLDELKVTGYGTSRKETMLTMSADNEDNIDSLWLKATPVPGKLAYLTYLQTTSKKLLLDSTIKGIEIISFIVNRKGELSAFKVEQSLSQAHDSATIRLLQEGPAWKLLRGRRARTSVRLSF